MIEPYYSDEVVPLYHGDCRGITEWLAADVLVTDPPYGMGLRSGWGGKMGDLRVTGDSDTGTRDRVLALWAGRPALVFGRWDLSIPTGSRMRLTWEKGNHVGMGDLSIPWRPNTEDIFVIGTGFAGHRDSSVLRHLAVAGCVGKENTGQRYHPTEKPIALLATLLAKCPQGVIADPFAGGGSTLVAAKQQGRQAIGVELEERYCETVAKRLSQGVLDFGVPA